MFGSFSSGAATGAPTVVDSPPKTKPTFGSFTGVANAGGTPTPLTRPQPPSQSQVTSGSGLMTPSLLTKAGPAAGAAVPPAPGASNKVVAYNTGTGKMELVERQSRSYASVVSAGAGRFRVTGEAAPKLVPKAEYDFEQANARLTKEHIPDAPREAFYDKSSSFFDNISCEATVGKDGKMDKNERRWNIETFGVPVAPGHHHYHHHNRYRGGSHQQHSGGRHSGYGGGQTGGPRRTSNYQQRSQYQYQQGGGAGRSHLHQHPADN